jgi:microcystin-dependent protein
MAEPFIGEIRAFGFNFAPIGWLQCNGQLLAVQQFAPLFSIIGTTYGGNGTSTFALPNLQGETAMHQGAGPGLTPRTLGQTFGTDSVTLIVQQMPSNNHMLAGAIAGAGSQRVPKATNQALLGGCNPGQVYTNTLTPQVAFSPKAIGATGNAQPHNNLQPLLVLNFCIATEGIFPTRD